MQEIKERPIIFSAPMVQAILENRKTITRRIIKKQPDTRHGRFDFENGCLKESSMVSGCWDVWRKQYCPYGQVGDHLWVRENFILDVAFDDLSPAMVHETKEILYTADNVPFDYWHGKNRPSIFMPRWASRILLEITGVKVERLNDISEEDAKAEGAQPSVYSWPDGTSSASAMDCNGLHRNGFRNLWESINGNGSWWLNPYVWAIEFRRI
jgi:hypothetical protein